MRVTPDCDIPDNAQVFIAGLDITESGAVSTVFYDSHVLSESPVRPPEPDIYAAFTTEAEARVWLRETLSAIRSTAGAALLRMT